MEIKGVVKVVGSVQEVTDKFSKRELVVTTEADTKYPQHLPIQFSNTKMALLDNLVEGQEVTVSINLRGRESNGKYYGSIDGWKIDAVASKGY